MGGRIGYGTLSSLAVLASAFSAFDGRVARAQTYDITGDAAITNPIDTANPNGAGPANISIANGSSVTVSGPTALTIDSSNTLTNAGSITNTSTANSTALFVNLGQTSPVNLTTSIDNTGFITAAGLDPSDAGAASSINNRGISVTGLGTMTGNILNDVGGQIEVGANQGMGIAIQSNLIGNVTNNGTITALGNDSFGIMTTGQITGTVTTAGVIYAQGSNSVGVYIGGGINGTYIHTGDLEVGAAPQLTTTNGITYTTTTALSGYAGIWIASNVTQGVLLGGYAITQYEAAVNPALTTDNTTPESTIDMIGSGPALFITQGGPSQTLANITIGPRTDTGYSVVEMGNMTSTGSIGGITATAVEIDGAKSGSTIFTTSLPGGMWFDGSTITVNATDNTAYGVHIGNYASVSRIVNTGEFIITTTDSTANSVTGITGTRGGDTYGILVEPLGQLNSFVNTDTISSTAAGINSSAYGIIDRSGTLTDFVNQYGGSITTTIASGGTGHTVAVDMSANATGATFTNAGDIIGDVLLGGGNNTVTVTGLNDGTSNGTITGNVIMQAGAAQSGNNTVIMNAGVVTGQMYLGNGYHTVTLTNSSAIKGGLSAGTGSTLLNVSGSSQVELLGAQPLNVSNATFTTGSILNFSLGNTAPLAPVMNASGTVFFGAGTTVTAAYTGILTSTQTYTLIQANALQFGTSLSQIGLVPPSFLNTSVLQVSPSNPNVLQLIVTPKTAAQLGLGPNETAVYNLFAVPMNQDQTLATAIEAQGTNTQFQSAFKQLLPDTSGASLQVALDNQDMADGEIRRRLMGVAKNGLPDHALGDVSSFWAQAIGDDAQQSPRGEEQGFDVWGLGVAVGTDTPIGEHAIVGMSVVETFHSASLEVSPNSPVQFYSSLGYLYGRLDLGPAYLQAMGGAGINNFIQSREVDINSVTRTANAKWNGYQYGGEVEAGATAHFDEYSLTPFLRGGYLKEHEDGYSESGGGPAVDLTVSPKDPQASVRGSAGFNFDRDFPVYYDSYVEAEFRANYTREFTHSPIDVSASFASGSPTFINVGNPRPPNRYTVGLGLASKDSYSTISLDYDLELANGFISHMAGVTARFRF